MPTVYAAFKRVAARRGDAPFLVVDEITAASYNVEPGARTWREVAGEVERLRAAYERAGYGHGHRVGILLENRPAFFTHWLALNSLGISVVPINAELGPIEWTWLIGHSEMSLAVVQPGREGALRAAANEAHAQLETIRPEVLGNVPPARFPAKLAAQPIGRDTECALLYTSGTTGRSKGCRLANGYFLRAGEWYLGLGGLAEVVPSVDRFITPLPLSHMNALAFSSMAAILSGGSLVQLDRFHPTTWWQSVRDTQATVVHYLGVMPAMLLAAPPSPLDRQHNVRFGFGAGVDPLHHAAFEERFGFPLLEAWAMTETGAAACIMANHEPRHPGTRCFGRAEPFVETRVVADDGSDVAAGVAGELLVRASGAESRKDFFLGYLKDAAATEDAWAGGWFHTGDVVRRSAEGDFHFVDRRKNVIRRSGENISAVEVESVLNTHLAVEASAVAATPDPVRGDEVLACIVLRKAPHLPAPEQIAASICRHALERLAYFKAPAYIAFVDALPLTASQKIQRADLRELAKKLPGSTNCFDMRQMKRRRKMELRGGAPTTASATLSTTSGTLAAPAAAPAPSSHALDGLKDLSPPPQLSPRGVSPEEHRAAAAARRAGEPVEPARPKPTFVDAGFSLLSDLDEGENEAPLPGLPDLPEPPGPSGERKGG